MRTSLLIVFLLGAFRIVHAEDGAIWYAALKAPIQKSIEVTNITSSSADIKWTYPNPPQGVPVRYGTDIKNPHTSTEKCNSTPPCVHLTQLTPSTTYEFRLPTYNMNEDGSRAELVYEVGGSFQTGDVSGHGGAFLSTTTTPRHVTIQYKGPATQEDIAKMQATIAQSQQGTSSKAVATDSIAVTPENARVATHVLTTQASKSSWFVQAWEHLGAILSAWF
jgi:hypothetical protein